MKILVTGGSGYLGTRVRTFFGADDFSRRSYLDILNHSDTYLVSDYDVVIHLAAHLDKSPEGADACFATNAEGTANLLRQMRPNSVFIYASTKDVYGRFADEYAEVPETCPADYCGQSGLEWSKLIGEKYTEFYANAGEFRACVFRLSAVYARPSEGNEHGFVTHYVESVKRGLPVRLPAAGKPIRDILHVDDLCRACQAFIDSEVRFGIYNVGGGKENSDTLRGLIDRIARVIQCEAVIDDDASLPGPVPFNYVSDIRKIHRELGWKPEFGIEAGIVNVI